MCASGPLVIAGASDGSLAAWAWQCQAGGRGVGGGIGMGAVELLRERSSPDDLPVTSMALGGDQQFLATGGEDCTIRTWGIAL